MTSSAANARRPSVRLSVCRMVGQFSWINDVTWSCRLAASRERWLLQLQTLHLLYSHEHHHHHHHSQPPAAAAAADSSQSTTFSDNRVISTLPRQGREVLSWVCLFVCLSALITLKHAHGWPIPNILCMLSVTMAPFSSDAVAILFPVLWMTSRLHTIGPMGQNEAGRYILKKFARWQYQFHVRQLQCLVEFIRVRGENLLSTIDLLSVKCTNRRRFNASCNNIVEIHATVTRFVVTTILAETATKPLPAPLVRSVRQVAAPSICPHRTAIGGGHIVFTRETLFWLCCANHASRGFC